MIFLTCELRLFQHYGFLHINSCAFLMQLQILLDNVSSLIHYTFLHCLNSLIFLCLIICLCILVGTFYRVDEGYDFWSAICFISDAFLPFHSICLSNIN